MPDADGDEGPVDARQAGHGRHRSLKTIRLWLSPCKGNTLGNNMTWHGVGNEVGNTIPAKRHPTAESEKPCQHGSILSQHSINSPGNPETVCQIQKLSGQSRICLDNPEIVWTTQKVSGQSRNCTYNPETFWTVCTFVAMLLMVWFRRFTSKVFSDSALLWRKMSHHCQQNLLGRLRHRLNLTQGGTATAKKYWTD